MGPGDEGVKGGTSLPGMCVQSGGWGPHQSAVMRTKCDLTEPLQRFVQDWVVLFVKKINTQQNYS